MDIAQFEPNSQRVYCQTELVYMISSLRYNVDMGIVWRLENGKAS
jgi:hypothetical protein